MSIGRFHLYGGQLKGSLQHFDEISWDDAIPNMPPFESIAAATCVSVWVSTPPITFRTIDMTAPFTRSKGVAHAT